MIAENSLVLIRYPRKITSPLVLSLFLRPTLSIPPIYVSLDQDGGFGRRVAGTHNGCHGDDSHLPDYPPARMSRDQIRRERLSRVMSWRSSAVGELFNSPLYMYTLIQWKSESPHVWCILLVLSPPRVKGYFGHSSDVDTALAIKDEQQNKATLLRIEQQRKPFTAVAPNHLQEMNNRSGLFTMPEDKGVVVGEE